MNRLGDTSAFVIPAGKLLLSRRGKTRMYTVGIVFEFYTVPLKVRGVGIYQSINSVYCEYRQTDRIKLHPYK